MAHINIIISLFLCLLISNVEALRKIDVKNDVNNTETELSFFNGVFLLAGSTGDLAKRKLIPALYELLKQKKLSGLIVFMGRQENLTARDIIEKAKPFIKNRETLFMEKLIAMSMYWHVSGQSKQEFVALKEALEVREREGSLLGARIAFLALPADSFCSYTKNLVESGIILKGNKQQRIVYEKPFGSDLASAREINACIQDALSYEQAYRVDHYLAKNILEELPSLIQNSMLLSPAWNKCSIQSVKIFFDESIGLEGRGAFYDKYGALSDVVQNHVLQIVAVIASGMCYSKLEVLKALAVKQGVRAQYADYQREPGVTEKSETETYIALELEVTLPEWKGVPFLIQAGKHLQRKATEVEILFKAQNNQVGQTDKLIISIAPEERLSLELHTKQLDGVVKTVTMTSLFNQRMIDAYENVLYDLMSGQSKAAVSLEEIEAQWAFVEQVKKLKMPFVCYKRNTAGPEIGQKLMLKA